MNSIISPQHGFYPESDGKPMADNTLQFQWIVTIQGNLDAMFRGDPQVFVAGDLLWYPVEGNNRISVAPDVMAIFGRPKGYRGSYLQWLEGNIAPQVVFEVLSNSNRASELAHKFQFYLRYGVEEYYLLDPNLGKVDGWRRIADEFEAIESMDGWISPRLGIRFEIADNAVNIYKPDESRFLTYLELQELADLEHTRADMERERADVEHKRAERMAARLRELGENPD